MEVKDRLYYAELHRSHVASLAKIKADKRHDMGKRASSRSVRGSYTQPIGVRSTVWV